MNSTAHYPDLFPAVRLKAAVLNVLISKNSKKVECPKLLNGTKNKKKDKQAYHVKVIVLHQQHELNIRINLMIKIKTFKLPISAAPSF